MTNYTKTTDFAAKDSLPSGNAAKIVKGSEIDTEFNNIATASATKANANNAALTGTTTAQTLDISGNVDVDGTLETDALSLNGVTVTSTAAELNILDGVTSTAAELNILDGVTSTTAELNILDGVTSTAAELNILDGVTATTAELNYVDGVTSNVQTQLNTKAPLASPTFTGTVTAAGLTVDTTTLVVDASNNRVGIGTASPYSALTVDTANGILNIANGNTSGGTKIQAWAATPANGYLAIEGYDKEYVRIDASGNVGIGTGSPSSYLAEGSNLVIADSSHAGITVASGASSEGGIFFADGTSGSDRFRGMIRYNHASNYMEFRTDAGERMRIDGSGNVGIGTSSPSAKLTVVGTTKVGEGAASNTSKLMVNTASGTAAGIQLFQDSVESWIIDNPASSTGLTFSNSGTERMRIDGSGNVSVSSSAGLVENAVGVFMLPAGELRVKDNTENGTAQISTYNNNVTADAEQFFVGNNLADVDIGNKRGALKFFASSGTERMRIDTNGNLLAGTTSSTNAGKVRIQGATADAADSTVLTLHQNNLNVGGASLIKIGTEANNFAKSAIGFKRTDAYDRGAIIFCQENTGDQSDVDSSDEVMRIDASGNLLVGTITSGYAFQSGVAVNPVNGGSSYVAVAHPDGTGSGNSYALFTYNAGIIGSIAQNGTTGVSYNTSSDQRLKENIADADDAGRKVDAIQVRSFDWIADGTHQDYGMIAQELQSVAPEAVSAPEDPEEMMGVDYSKLVPMLVKEIQSLRARVAQLENN